MKNRKFGLVVALAATMLLLVIGPSAAFADPPVTSDYTYPTDVVVGDTVVVEISDFATDPNPDHTVTLGQDSCTVQVTDGFGPPSFPVTLTFNVVEPGPEDTEAPIVTITSPANGTTFTTNTTTLTYGVTDTVDPSPTCVQKINGVPFTGANVTLTAGLNTITVECTDAATNVGADSVDVTYTPPPVGDPVKINLENVTIREQDSNVSVYVPVRLSRPSPVDITLSYKTESKKAVGGVDYVEVTDGSLVIEAGETYGEIEITILGDDYRESSENFFVIGDIAIESGPYATLLKDQATVVITNDDR